MPAACAVAALTGPVSHTGPTEQLDQASIAEIEQRSPPLRFRLVDGMLVETPDDSPAIGVR